MAFVGNDLCYHRILFASMALASIVLLMPAPIVAHEVWKTFRLTISDIKFLKETKLKKTYAKIREMLK